MKNYIKKQALAFIIAATLSGMSPLAVPTAMAEETTEIAPSALKKVVYKNINPDFFGAFYEEEEETDQERKRKFSIVVDYLRQSGISFPQGASATYNPKKKTLTLINNKDEHEYFAKLIEEYKKDKKEHNVVINALEDCPTISGRVDKNADFYLFITVDNATVSFAEECGYNIEELFDYYVRDHKQKIKEIKAIQKLKGIETVLAVENGCNVRDAKKFFKLFKLRDPIISYNPNGHIASWAVFSGGVNIAIYYKNGREILSEPLMHYQLNNATIKQIKNDMEEAKEEFAEREERFTEEEEDFTEEEEEEFTEEEEDFTEEKEKFTEAEEF